MALPTRRLTSTVCLELPLDVTSDPQLFEGSAALRSDSKSKSRGERNVAGYGRGGEYVTLTSGGRFSAAAPFVYCDTALYVRLASKSNVRLTTVKDTVFCYF